jgi:hypothetical protein
MMDMLRPAQAGAQFFSLIIFATAARWYVAPRLRTLSRADALTPLVWLHAFRYVALQAFSAQHAGFPISDRGLTEIVVGDVIGAIIALATIVALRRRAPVAIPLAWLLVAETVFDTVTNIRGGVHENLLGAATGVTWLILGFYVPLLIVTVALIAWQLYSRRGEPAGVRRNAPNTSLFQPTH